MNFKVWSILSLVALVFVLTATAEEEDAQEKQLLANVKASWDTLNENFKNHGQKLFYKLRWRNEDEKRTSAADKAYLAYIMEKKARLAAAKPAEPLPEVEVEAQPVKEPEGEEDEDDEDDEEDEDDE